MRARIFKWVRSDCGERFENVGIGADGALYNPNGYPPEAVRAAVEAALGRRHNRLSAGAKRAALTRKRRQEKRVYKPRRQS